jgi:hypothetical protein
MGSRAGPRCYSRRSRWHWTSCRCGCRCYRGRWSWLGRRALHTAEYCATSSPSKGVTVGIDCQRPNVATRREKSTTDIAPTVAIICRAESSTCCACKNVILRIDCHCVYVRCRDAVILFCPTIAIVSRSEDTATITHERISCGKDVTVVVNPQPGDVRRG